MNLEKFKIKRSAGLKPPYLLVLFIVTYSSNFFPAQVAAAVFLLLAFITLIAGKHRISKQYLIIVWPLIIITIIGFAGIYGKKDIDVVRDVIYALNPIALIFLGYWMAERHCKLENILKYIVLGGLILALVHLSRFVLNPALISADLTSIGKESYVSGDLVVLAFALGLFQNRFHLGDLFPHFISRNISLIVLFFSFILSYSRTELVVLLVLCFSLLGYLHKVSIRRVVVGITLVSIIMIASLSPMIVSDSLSFGVKLLRSFEEMKISNYQSYEDISLNWRGFETYRVIITYANGTFIEKIFGQGFGALVDLGFTMTLAGSEYDYIPVVHNGYAYILIKTGIAGLLLYGLFYQKLLRMAFHHANSKDMQNKFLALLLIGIVLCLAITMYVVGGPAEVHSSEFILLIGYLTRLLKIARENGAYVMMSDTISVDLNSHK